MDEAKVRDILTHVRGFTHIVHERIRQELPPGVTVQQMMLMKALATEGALPQHRLADVLGLSKGGVSQCVTRLEEAGMVERRRDADDARIQWVHMTPQAHEMRDALERKMARAFADLFQDWQDADADRLIGLMDAMMERAR